MGLIVMLAEGQVIGNYRIVRKLGEGGMGAVFEGVHQDIGRRAAIKVLHPQFAASQVVAQRFLNEAKAANLIEHPGVVEIFEFNRLPDGTTYIVMEYLKGDSLAKRIERGPMGMETLRIVRQVASVLATAHEHGIIHRDLKPDNVIIVKDPEAPGGERAKVLDFGIAKIAEEQVLKTQANSILGTPVYMAPEQCRGASAVTDKSDVYSLGVMMYEMLAGQPPFMGQGIGEIMAAHLMNEPPPLRDIQPSVSPDVAALVHRLLKKDQAQRPTMREVIAELERLGAARTGVLSAVQDTLPVRNQAAPPDARTIMGEASAGTPVAAPPVPTPNRTMAIGDANLPPITKGPVVASGSSSAPHHTAVLPSPAPSIAKQPLVIAGVLGGLLSIGMGVFLYNRKHAAQVQKEKKPPTKPITNQQPKNDPKRNTPKKPVARPPDPNAPEGMVRVTGGTLQQGSTSDGVDSAMKLCQRRGVSCRRELYERETPQREVTISDFYMDKTEVTNQDMVAWLNKQQGLKVEKGRFVRIKKVLLLDLFEEQSGVTWSKKKDAPFQVREGDAKRPVSLVTWEGARRYCAGKYMRLPTEAEWEMAARGEDGRFYPWGGDSPQCPGVVFGRAATLPADRSCSTGERRPEPVGHAEQDQTPDGISDLAGNVAEWVQDVFVEHYPACKGECTDPVQTEPGAAPTPDPGADSTSKKAKGSKKKGSDASVMLRVVRGGSFSLPADACRGAGRSRRAEDQAKMDIGFRCAMAVKK